MASCAGRPSWPWPRGWSTALVGVAWWWGLQRVATARGLDLVVGDQTWSFVRYAALLAALAAVAGASVAVLLRGWLAGC